MDWYVKLVIIYLCIINIVSSVVTLYDKAASQRKLHRVSERNLIIFSLLGGSVMMYITMRLIRHKTLHGKFMIGIPVIFVFQAALVVAAFYLVRYV